MSAFTDNPFELFPSHRHLGTELSGNEIIVDTTAGENGPVLGLWHDPAAIVVLGRTEREFRTRAPGLERDHGFELPADIAGLVDEALDWSNSAMLTHETAVQKFGTTLAGWLASLPPQAAICDLRECLPGTGMQWGLSDTFTEHPTELVLARITAPKRPGLLQRWFG